MNFLKGLYRNARLGVRLTMPVAVVLLVFLLICQWMIYAVTANTFNDQLLEAAASSVTNARSYLDTQLRNIIDGFYYIRLDASIEEDLTGYLQSEDTASEAVTMGRLTRTLSLHRATEPLLASLLLYTPKQLFSADGNPMTHDFVMEESSLWQLLQQSDAPILFAPTQRDEIYLSHRQVVPVLHRFPIEGYGGECVLLANIDRQKLTTYLHTLYPQDGSEILLVDQNGTLITISDRTAVLSLAADSSLIRKLVEADVFVETELAGESFLLGSCRLHSAPWTLIYMQSRQQVYSHLHQLQFYFSFMTLAVLILLVLVLVRIMDSITKPLIRLCEHISTSESQNLDTPFFEYPYQDEIGTLAAAYNSMLRRIHHLLDEQAGHIAQLKEEKRRADIEQELKRRAELRALQAQINPHFLYNTLDSIRWKAEKAGAGDISQMTTALATLFRVGLSRGQEIIPVSQEARHVESYLMIQKQRYSDRLSYRVDFQSDILPLYTVKLILQPLVENAIYHGIKESDHSGMVIITGHRDGDVLEMQVIDNGLGIPGERLKLLQADLARGRSVSREGYGIFNVNERIRLHFGAQYGLTLESEWGKGTVATVRLPCIPLEEVEKYVSNPDS